MANTWLGFLSGGSASAARIFYALLTVLWSISAPAQISTTAPPPTKVTAPGPHAPQAPGGHPIMTGTIYGFVYWDANITSHLGPSVCSALAITVAVANKGSYSPFAVVGTQSHLTSIATVHPLLTSVNTTSYDGCAYSFGNAPLGQNLYVTLSLTQLAGTLTPAVVAKNPAIGPIQFSNVSCNKLPPLTKATIANLTGTWGSCQDVAYDVNLPLVKAAQLTVLSSSGGSAGNQSSMPGAFAPATSGPQNTPLLIAPGLQQTPMLSQPGSTGALLNNQLSASSLSRGMLVPAVKPPPAAAPSNSQPGTPGLLLPATPGGGGTVQLNPQPYPPKGTIVAPGGSANTVQLNPQPYPPKGSTGPTQTMSAGSPPSSGITGSKAGARPAIAALNTGTVSGFIYWDTSKTGFQSSCNGVSVFASLDQGNSVSRSWQGRDSSLTYSARGPLAVCAYTITGAPAGLALDITPTVNWPDMALGVNLWSQAGLGDQGRGSFGGGLFGGEYDVVTIQKTSCTVLLGANKMASQNLRSGPRSCGNRAANVNLILVSTPPQPHSTPSGNTGPRTTGAKP